MPASAFTKARQPSHSSTWLAMSAPSRLVRSPSTKALKSASKRAHAPRARSASSWIDVGSLMTRRLQHLGHRTQQFLARPADDPLQILEPHPHPFGGAAVLEPLHLDQLQSPLLPLLQLALEDAVVGEQAESVHLRGATGFLLLDEQRVGRVDAGILDHFGERVEVDLHVRDAAEVLQERVADDREGPVAERTFLLVAEAVRVAIDGEE